MTCRIRSCELTRKASLASILAAVVLVGPSLAAQGETGKQGGKEAKDPAARPAAGAAAAGMAVDAPHWIQARSLLQAKLVGQDGKQLGEIADLIFLPYGGVFDGAVVKLPSNEQKVKVPFTSLQWQAKDRSYATAMTREQLAAMPRFDPAEYRHDAGQAKAADAATDGKEGKKEGAAAPASARRPAQYLLLSALEQHAVHAGEEQFGRVAQVITEAKPRSIVFVTVKAGTDLAAGDVYVMPWRALRCDESGKLLTSVDSAKLESAPKLERLESLDDPDFLRKLATFYAVPSIELPKSGDAGTR